MLSKNYPQLVYILPLQVGKDGCLYRWALTVIYFYSSNKYFP